MKKFSAALIAFSLMLTLSSCGKEEIFSPIGGETESSSAPESSTSVPVVPAESSLPESSQPPESSEEEPADPFEALIGSPIPESTPRDAAYLDDAIFIGDSLTEGLALYQVMPREQVLANTGINPQTILSKACIDQDGTKKTVTDASASLEPKKIYLMLGANGVAFLDFQDIIGWYSQLIDTLQAQHPDAHFYVQSILPVTRGKELEQKLLTNERIGQLNGMIAAMAAEKGCFYLNVSEALANEKGYLPDELSADGMHFGITTYQTWIDYLLSHTAEGALE